MELVALVWRFLYVLVVCVCLLESWVTSQEICQRVEDSSDPRGVVRYTCQGQNFDFTSFFYDATTKSLVVGGTNRIFVFNTTLHSQRQVSLTDSVQQAECLSRCGACAINPHQFLLQFCQDPRIVGCPPSVAALCVNLPVLVRSVVDVAGRTLALTCGSSYSSSNSSLKNCAIRRLPDLTVLDEFHADLSLRRNARFPVFLNIGTGTGAQAGINAAGTVTGPLYSAGYTYGAVRQRFAATLPVPANYYDFSSETWPTVQRLFSGALVPPARDIDLVFGTNGAMLNADLNRFPYSRYHVQYVYSGYMYIFASNVETNNAGTNSHGAYVWRYCLNDNRHTTYITGLQRIELACTGVARLRGFRQTVGPNDALSSSTRRWELRDMASAVEVNRRARNYVLAAFNSFDGSFAEGSAVCAYSKDRVHSSFTNQDPRYGVQASCTVSPHLAGASCPTNLDLNQTDQTAFSAIDYTLYQEGFIRAPTGRVVPDVPTWFAGNILIEKIAFTEDNSMYYIFVTARGGRVLQLASPLERFLPALSALDLRFQKIDEYVVGQSDNVNGSEIFEIQITPTVPLSLVVTTSASVETRTVSSCRAYSSNCSACLGVTGSFQDLNCVYCWASSSCENSAALCPGGLYYPPSLLFNMRSMYTCSNPLASGFPGDFSAQPTDATVSRGEAVVLTCSVGATTAGFAVAWRREGAAIDLVADPPRVTVVTTPASTLATVTTISSTLTIRSVSAADGGRYVCRAVSGQLVLESRNATVNVRPYLISFPPSAVGLRGQALSLSCQIDAYPPVAYTWTQNGVILTSSDSANTFFTQPNQLLFNPTVLANFGVFVCSGTNAFGTAVSNGAQVAILDVESASSSLISSMLGSELTLSCPMPSTSYKWFYDGAELPGETSANYTLGNTTSTSHGLYRCQFSALDAAMSHSFVVRIPGVPRIVAVPTPSVSVAEGGTVRLVCAVDFFVFPVPVISWFHDNVSHAHVPVESNGSVGLSQNGEVLQISDVGLQYSGVYRCMVANSMGFVSASSNVSVTPRLSILGHPESQVLGAASLTFQCSVQGPEGFTASFSKNNLPLLTTSRIDIRSWPMTAFVAQAVLTITEPSNSDIGSYQCVGNLTVGSKTSTVTSPFVIYQSEGAVSNAATSEASSISQPVLIGGTIGTLILGLVIGALLTYLVVKRADRGAALDSPDGCDSNGSSHHSDVGYINGSAGVVPGHKVMRKNNSASSAHFMDTEMLAADEKLPPPPTGVNRVTSTATEVTRLSFAPSNGSGNISVKASPMTPGAHFVGSPTSAGPPPNGVQLERQASKV